MWAATANRKLTPGQLKKVFAAARELNWDDARLHAELERVIGATSLQVLTVNQGKLFIDYMVSLGATSGRHSSPSCQVDGPRQNSKPGNLIELATPAQQRLVDELLGLSGLTRESPYLLGCLKQGLGRTTIRTRRDAQVAITILRRILQLRKAGKQHSASLGRQGHAEGAGNLAGESNAPGDGSDGPVPLLPAG